MVVTQFFRELLKVAARKNGHALIVNVGALLASNSYEFNLPVNTPRYFTPYAMSKAGVNLYTSNLARDWKPDGIRCTVLHPGWVQTDLGGDDGSGFLQLIEESASGMIDTTFKLKEQHSGLFYDWKFEPIPW